MDKQYVDFFIGLAESNANSAEQIMEHNLQNNDKNGYSTAQIIYADFSDLKERIKQAGETYEVTRQDAAKLALGAIIFTSQLENRVNELTDLINHYKKNIIPSLQEIVDAESDEAALALSNEKFIIKNE